MIRNGTRACETTDEAEKHVITLLDESKIRESNGSGKREP
jgi:hypothetical protein